MTLGKLVDSTLMARKIGAIRRRIVGSPHNLPGASTFAGPIGDAQSQAALAPDYIALISPGRQLWS